MASDQLSRFAILLLGGAPLSPGLEAALQEAAGRSDCRIFHGFGMTETLTHIATRPLGTEALGQQCMPPDFPASFIRIPAQMNLGPGFRRSAPNRTCQP